MQPRLLRHLQCVFGGPGGIRTPDLVLSVDVDLTAFALNRISEALTRNARDVSIVKGCSPVQAFRAFEMRLRHFGKTGAVTRIWWTSFFPDVVQPGIHSVKYN